MKTKICLVTIIVFVAAMVAACSCEGTTNTGESIPAEAETSSEAIAEHETTTIRYETPILPANPGNATQNTETAVSEDDAGQGDSGQIGSEQSNPDQNNDAQGFEGPVIGGDNSSNNDSGSATTAADNIQDEIPEIITPAQEDEAGDSSDNSDSFSYELPLVPAD